MLPIGVQLHFEHFWMQHSSEQKNNAVVLVHSSLHATTDANTAAGKRPGKLFVCLFFCFRQGTDLKK